MLCAVKNGCYKLYHCFRLFCHPNIKVPFSLWSGLVTWARTSHPQMCKCQKVLQRLFCSLPLDEYIWKKKHHENIRTCQRYCKGFSKFKQLKVRYEGLAQIELFFGSHKTGTGSWSLKIKIIIVNHRGVHQGQTSASSRNVLITGEAAQNTLSVVWNIVLAMKLPWDQLLSGDLLHYFIARWIWGHNWSTKVFWSRWFEYFMHVEGGSLLLFTSICHQLSLLTEYCCLIAWQRKKHNVLHK